MAPTSNIRQSTQCRDPQHIMHVWLPDGHAGMSNILATVMLPMLTLSTTMHSCNSIQACTCITAWKHAVGQVCANLEQLCSQLTARPNLTPFSSVLRKSFPESFTTSMPLSRSMFLIHLLAWPWGGGGPERAAEQSQALLMKVIPEGGGERAPEPSES